MWLGGWRLHRWWRAQLRRLSDGGGPLLAAEGGKAIGQGERESFGVGRDAWGSGVLLCEREMGVVIELKGLY